MRSVDASTEAFSDQDGVMRTILSSVFPVLTVAALVGCADDVTTPEPSTEEVDATADALALAEGLGLPGTNADRETGSAPTGTSRQPCRYDEAKGRWVCPPVTRDGLTLQRSFAYLDGDGNPMRRFDRLLTAATHTRNAVFGTVQRENATVQIRSAGEMTVSGLLGEETTHIFDGREIGKRETSLVTDQGTASSVLEFANKTEAVVVPVVRRTAGVTQTRQWPLSGQIIRFHIVTTTRNGATHTERWKETTTFNGTAIVPVEIVSSRGTRSCERNLETRELRCD
jgi:hypothetical protein